MVAQGYIIYKHTWCVCVGGGGVGINFLSKVQVHSLLRNNFGWELLILLHFLRNVHLFIGHTLSSYDK